MTANEETVGTYALLQGHGIAIEPREDQDIREYVRALEERVMKLEAVVLQLTTRIPGYAIDYGAPNNTNEECRVHACSYYTHYLAYGPADLEHEGYHAAEKMASEHIEHCGIWKTASRPCKQCIDWEKRVRA